MFWQQIEFSRILENESIGAKCPLYRDLGIRKRERLMTSPFFVRAKGLEPIRLAAPDPKSGLATNYNTPATSFLKTFHSNGTCKFRNLFPFLQIQTFLLPLPGLPLLYETVLPSALTSGAANSLYHLSLSPPTLRRSSISGKEVR